MSDEELEWVKRMVKLEEERGELPPGGFGGGVRQRYLRIPLRVCRPNGSVAYYDEGRRQVAVVFRGDETFDYSKVIDLRSKPPFLPMSPCPYCGAVEDRGHDALMHVDKRLGVAV